jgi:uncharacterized protein YjbJ (UPF0337 family)
LSREPSRSSLLAKKVEFFLRGRLVDPLARFGDTIFEEQYELNWVPSIKSTRQANSRALAWMFFSLLMDSHIGSATAEAKGRDNVTSTLAVVRNFEVATTLIRGAYSGSLCTSINTEKFAKESVMDWNRVEGNWKQIKGQVKEKWGKLTDDDLTAINGKREQLEGKIQERYGVAKDQARKDVDDWYAKQSW